MTPERWRRINELFQGALDREGAERAAFLDASCGSDEALRREVDSLVAAHLEAGAFGEMPESQATLAEDGGGRSLAAGTRLGPYEILDLIAAGGMGEVYRARDGRLSREVAVKVLPASSLADAGRLRRFHQEARAAGALNHPNILAVYDVGTEGAQPYVVSELLEGETLRARLARAGALETAHAADVSRQVAAGLVAAHEKGIVHRDLKPPNLFLTRDGRVKILDFGLAKRLAWPAAAEHPTSPTQPGVLLGTAGYMSPEQVRGEEVDPSTDVFSFGAVLFEMLSGRRAFAGGSPVETLAAILDAHPDLSLLPPDVPTGLREVLARCLERERGRRFPTARELQAALADASFSVRAPSGPVAAAPPRASVAVLPFRDLSARAEVGHLGLALADATITELARRGSLLVRPTSAVLRYQAGAPDPRAAGRELAVDAVVEGSFQRSGDRVRVTVQLVAVDAGRPVWGTKVDVSLSDVFAMQDEVSGRIAEALRGELSAAPRAGSPARPPSAGAYELYIKGKLALWRESLADCIAAVDWFEKAREADPGFALAWAGLADAYVRIAFEFQPEGDWYSRAEAMCERALSLDPELPEARYVRARLVWSPRGGFDHERGLRELLAALAGRPSLDDAHVRMAVILFHVGMIDEAQAALERALALSPEHLVAMGHVASCHFHRGDFARARDVVDAVARQNPSYWHQNLAGQSRVRLGDVEGAAAVADRMSTQGEERIARAHGLQAVVAARRGDAARAHAHVEQAVASRKPFGHYHHVQYDVACVHALLGDAGEAVRWLRDASGSGYPCHPFFAVDPLLDRVRADPRFAAWLDEVRREDEGYARLYADLGADAPWNRDRWNRAP